MPFRRSLTSTTSARTPSPSWLGCRPLSTVVEEMARSPLGRPAPGVAVAAASPRRPTAARFFRPKTAHACDPIVALGRHGVSSGGDLSPEYERDDVTEVGDTRTRAQMQPTAEQLSPPARRWTVCSTLRCPMQRSRRRPVRAGDAPVCLTPSRRVGPEQRLADSPSGGAAPSAAEVKSAGFVSSPSGDDEEEVLSRLRSAGDRVTTPRRLLVRCLFVASGHRTAEELAAEIQARAPDISISTVYRNLESSSALALWCTPISGMGLRLITSLNVAHGHLVCRKCEIQLEIAEGFFADLRRRAIADFGFAIDPRHFALIGLCANMPGHR